MKNFFSFLLLIVSISLISCSEDDTKTYELQNTTWYRMMTVEGEVHEVRLEFKENIYYFTWPDGAPEGHNNSEAKISISLSEFSIGANDDADCEGQAATYGWSIAGDVLVLNAKSDDCEGRVIAISQVWQRLVFKAD
jgi:hypothetical protein